MRLRDPNVSNPTRRKRVGIVVSNPTVSTTTGWPVGFWWSELTHPYYLLTEKGYEVEVFSPAGGRCEADAMSDPRDPSGYSSSDLISMEFIATPKLAALVENTRKVSEMGASTDSTRDRCIHWRLVPPVRDGRNAMGLLLDKNAVIYGAGGAIGGAVARAFAREGAKVFLAGRTLSKLDALAEEITAAGGVAETAQVDALDERAVTGHADTVAQRTGGIDVSFNAIGMEDVQGTPLLDMPLEDFLHPIIVATRTQFLTARAVARRMAEKGSGVILTIIAGPPEAIAYIGGFGPACEAIQGLWRGLAAELGPRGVRLICLRSAGSPDTPDVQETFKRHAKAAGVTPEEFLANVGSGTLLRRLPTVAEVANVATMMASDWASAMTGTFVNVTCGSRSD